jgi:murein DD-endopeptidase MepM/ murein hydrolase activator NlpD
MRTLVVVVAGLALVIGGAYAGAGWMAGPAVQLEQPVQWVGASTPIELVVESPLNGLSALDVRFEQDGQQATIFSLGGDATAAVREEGGARVRITRRITPQTVPGLKSGPGRVMVRAEWPVLYGLRRVHTDVTRDVTVRLERPRLSVVSSHHYINLGGSEAIVYRVTPDDVVSGVRVGNIEYPGYRLSGAATAGATATDPTLRVAFFALRYDQPMTQSMELFARDEAGNTADAQFERRVFLKPSRASRIDLNDAFLARVVPAILAGTKDIAPTGSLIEQFVAINGELRRRNAERIASFARETSPDMLWQGAVFHPFTNTSAESAFADRRTYIYQNREVDQQVHLGFDLASFANTPIVAAGRGKVLFAAELGIYGNTVIVDHGMGLQSLYAHLSGIDVPVGAMVEKGQTLGRSGMTGMAGGDHLHFTMLLHGQMVTPVEWWDAHWIEDRILRKLREAR